MERRNDILNECIREECYMRPRRTSKRHEKFRLQEGLQDEEGFDDKV